VRWEGGYRHCWKTWLGIILVQDWPKMEVWSGITWVIEVCKAQLNTLFVLGNDGR
jgi:hypothetical protein